MKEVMSKVVILSLVLAFPVASLAQESGKTLAATMEVYVFPSSGQDSSQQSMDD